MDFENPYASPLTDSKVKTLYPVRDDLGWLLFSFQRRIPRRKYWAVMVVSWFIASFFGILLYLPTARELLTLVTLALVLIPLNWIFLLLPCSDGAIGTSRVGGC